MKILIVGGVAGGASAAARLRRLSKDDEIILFEKDEYISFANCGLPYYIGGVIEQRDKLLVQTVAGMKQRFDLDIRNFQEVVALHPDKKIVEVYNHQTKESYEESYDTLILSPGANPIWPNLPGLAEAKNVFKLRNVPDTDRIKEMLVHQPKQAVVIGGGFIGVEMAENLRHLGMDVTLVDLAEQVLTPFDPEISAVIQNEITRNGVQLKLGVGLEGFTDEGKTVLLSNGEKLSSDLTILAIGVSPASKLAKDAGLQLGLKNTIVVDAQLKTSDPNIYAIGDVIQVNHLISNTPTYIPLAWPANRQGRLVADHIHGIDIAYEGTLGSSVAKVFDMVAASTGLNEVMASKLGYDVGTTIVHRGNHAGYYPNAKNLTLKLVYDKETLNILGAQGVGYEGTEKRIDVIATAIFGKLKVADLAKLELCYAPPFSSAKDPVNILGYAASHTISGLYETINYQWVDQLDESTMLLDVRTPKEYAGGHIPGSVNLELDTLRDHVDKLPKDKETPIVVYCQVGQRAHYALCLLDQLGYKNLYNVSGGYTTYNQVQIAQKKHEDK
ncbi:CoA-disulfide reductase [Erysipelotrichaceae bacterium MTC7]|nr:CoA-disulfide reductase [Erysipelotrichaceae bacterium MTC7]